MKSGPGDGKDSVDVQEQSFYLKGSYGILDQTTVELLVPYRSVDVDELGLDDTGFGDLELLANLRLPIKKKCWFALGFSIPTGESDSEDVEGELINASLQQGRGAMDIIAGLSHLYHLGVSTVIYCDTRLRMSLYENSEDYRYGAMLDSTVGGSVALGPIDVFADLFWTYSESDRNDGSKAADSGGDMFFLTPGIRCWVMDNVALTVKNQWLIAEQAKGEQMIPESIFSVGLTAMWGGK